MPMLGSSSSPRPRRRVANLSGAVTPAPDAPAWASIASTNTQTTLTLGSVTGATGYTFQRGETINGPWETLASNQAGTSFVDTTATAGVVYPYRAYAHGPGGMSAASVTRLGMIAVTQTSVFDAAAITDAWFAEDTPDTNNGSSALLSLKFFATLGSDRRGVLAVNTSGTPASGLALGATAVATGATLTLYANTTSTSSRTYEVHTLASGNHDWVEAEVTWNNRRAATAWAGSAGGETAGTDYHSGAVGSWSYTANEAAGTRKDITLSGSNVFTQIEAGALHLLLSRTSSSSGAAPDWRSSESSTTAERPQLTVTWYEPWSDVTTVRYLSPSGSNAANGQTSGTAWQTFAYALTQVAPGTVLVVAGGTYNESPQLASGTTQSGTAVAPVVVRAADGATPTIAGAFKINDAHYWTFDGISVDGSAVAYDPLVDALVFVRNSNEWEWRGSELRSKTAANTSAGTGGFKTLIYATGANPRIRWNHIHHNPGLNPDVTPDADGNAIYQDHLIYVSSGSGALIEHNDLHDAPNGRAVKVGASSGANPDPTNSTIRNNTIYACPGPDPLRYSYGTTGNVVEGCLIGGPTVNDGGGGSGIGIISTHSPDGSDTMATVSDTWAWDASGGATAMVDAGQSNIVEGSGNSFGTDPQLDASDAPGHASLTSGGVYTRGHLRGLASAADFPVAVS